MSTLASPRLSSVMFAAVGAAAAAGLAIVGALSGQRGMG